MLSGCSEFPNNLQNSHFCKKPSPYTKRLYLVVYQNVYAVQPYTNPAQPYTLLTQKCSISRFQRVQLSIVNC